MKAVFIDFADPLTYPLSMVEMIEWGIEVLSNCYNYRINKHKSQAHIIFKLALPRKTTNPQILP